MERNGERGRRSEGGDGPHVVPRGPLRDILFPAVRRVGALGVQFREPVVEWLYLSHVVCMREAAAWIATICRRSGPRARNAYALDVRAVGRTLEAPGAVPGVGAP